MVEEIFEKKIKLFKKTKETKLTNELAPKNQANKMMIICQIKWFVTKLNKDLA